MGNLGTTWIKAMLSSENQYLELHISGGDFLLNPILLRALSGSFHIVLILTIFTTWVCQNLENNISESQTHVIKRRKPLHFKLSMFCSLGFAFLNFVFCFLNNFYWYKNGWTDEKIITLFDLSSKTVAWLVVSVVLNSQFQKSGRTNYPFVLIFWWACFLVLSCYFLVTDLYYNKHQFVYTFVWVPDAVSIIISLAFCYVGLVFKVESEDENLQEPLLNDNDVNGGETDKCSGDKTLTPYANASIISLVTFSWMSPLISLGREKVLDLEDIPQLAHFDSVRGAYPILESKLETISGGSKKTTTLVLVKALICTTWKEIAHSAVCVLLYTLASYVGPYLIDTFVQFLNGQERYENEGGVLVVAFCAAKLVESLSKRYWVFKVQQGGSGLVRPWLLESITKD